MTGKNESGPVWQAACLAACVWICGCGSSWLQPRPQARVRLENPDRLELSVYRVEPAGLRLVEELGRARRVESTASCGRYLVEARDGRDRLRLPLPLLDGLAPVLRLRVEAWPQADSGWAWIPPGPGLQGDLLGVGQPDERPARIVTLAGFWLARHEVRNADYCAFLNDGEAPDPLWLNLGSRKCPIEQDPTTGRFTSSQPELPVVTVSRSGAEAYCVWLTARSGRLHRLPREMEWEKAARGPETYLFAYGDRYEQGRANQQSGTLKPVGSYPPNGFGLCDMTGNAFEWTADAWAVDALEQAPDWQPSGAYGTLRGGSFVLDGVYLRNSFRMRSRPGVQADDFGFRVLREAGLHDGG